MNLVVMNSSQCFSKTVLQFNGASQASTSLTWKNGGTMTSSWFLACNNFPNIDSISLAAVRWKRWTRFRCQENGQTTNIHSDLTWPKVISRFCSQLAQWNFRRTCQVFMGYFEEYQVASAADGPKNNISVKPVPPEHTYNTRKRQRASEM